MKYLLILSMFMGLSGCIRNSNEVLEQRISYLEDQRKGWLEEKNFLLKSLSSEGPRCFKFGEGLYIRVRFYPDSAIQTETLMKTEDTTGKQFRVWIKEDMAFLLPNSTPIKCKDVK